MACIYIHLLLRNLSLILMLTRVDVLTPTVLHLAIVCFLVTTSSHGLTKDNSCYLVQVQRPDTEVLLIWFLNLVGYTTYSWSFIPYFLRLLWCTVTMLVQFIFLAILYNISVLSILIWTFTLFKKGCPWPSVYITILNGYAQSLQNSFTQTSNKNSSICHITPCMYGYFEIIYMT
jgi:hypothetical protein